MVEQELADPVKGDSCDKGRQKKPSKWSMLQSATRAARARKREDPSGPKARRRAAEAAERVTTALCDAYRKRSLSSVLFQLPENLHGMAASASDVGYRCAWCDGSACTC